MSEENTPATNPVEDKARSMGWVPPEEWVGDPPPNGFKSAEDFVKHGEEVLPMIRAEKRKLEEKVELLEGKLTSQQSTMRQFQQFTQQAIDRERKKNEALIADAEKARAAAISEGDGETAVQKEREIRDLQQSTPQPGPDPALQAEVDQWMTDNPWFNTKHGKRWADGLAIELGNQGVAAGLPTLQRIAAERRAEFPQEFEPPKPKPNPVEGGGRRPADSSGKKTWDALPAEAKEAFQNARDMMGKDDNGKWIYTKDQYLDIYYEED